MESKPSHNNTGVALSEDKVSLKSEVQQQDSKRTDIGGSGLMLSDITNVASSRATAVQEADYATTVSKKEIVATGDTPAAGIEASISKCSKSSSSSQSGVLSSSTAPNTFQQSSDSPSTDAAVAADRKLPIPSQNPPVAPIGKKPAPKPDDGPANPTEKPTNADGVKTVKRENSKGWF